MLVNCFDNFDLISEHFYNFGGTHFDLAANDQVPNDPNEPATTWMRRGANHVRIKYEEYLEYQKRLPQLVAHPKPINMDEWAYTPGRFETYPAYAWIFHEMFRHSDLYQMASHTFATALLTRDTAKPSLNANGLVVKLYRDHFGSIPVEVSGSSPQLLADRGPRAASSLPSTPAVTRSRWTWSRRGPSTAIRSRWPS